MTTSNQQHSPAIEQHQTLSHVLSQTLQPEQVAFDYMTRLLYSTDASNYQIMPIGVVFPHDADDVVAVHEIANQHAVPILPRGGGSSLAGQTVGPAIVMDFSRHMRRIRAIHAEQQSVTVEPGCLLGGLNRQLAGLDLMFGPDPASADRATIGGCIGNNATGAHSILYGLTADHIRRLEVVLASGKKVWLDAADPDLQAIRDQVAALRRAHAIEIQTRYPKTFRTVAGYALDKIDPANVNLNWLLAGSEGTLATITAAELALVPAQSAQKRRLALVHFDTLRAALEATPRILDIGPSAIELLDKFLMDKTRLQPEYAKHLTFVNGDPAAILIVEFYGETEADLKAKVDTLLRLLRREKHYGVVTQAISPAEQHNVWKVRKAGLGLLMSERREDKPTAFIEDAAVPVEQLANYVDDIHQIVGDAGTTYAIYAHASAGCLHIRPLIDLKTTIGREQYRQIAEAATQAAIKYAGTITGEHGQGIARGEFTEKLFGTHLMSAFREIKHAFDPHNRMNPGKIVDTPRLDDEQFLRYTPAYRIIPHHTRFDWSADGGLAGAAEMCNGAGVCRKEDSGTMCPSYMATRDEAHATRGRANALRLALSGHLPDNLGDRALHGVYDLCLACKACKVECPSSVDVARMKAEFQAIYHDTHGIPLNSRLVANIHRINALGSLMPGVLNAIMRSPIGLRAAGWVGLPYERPLPRIAQQRFTQLVPRSKKQHITPDAWLVVDTWTEYNHPAIGQALLHCADTLGLEMGILRLPGEGCCGRPAISKGLLDQAKRMAHSNIQGLDAHDPTPLIFLEPSCQSAFTDDYLTLVEPALQERAQQIAKRCISAESWLLDQIQAKQPGWHNPAGEILLHGHCHQKALWGTDRARALLEQIPEARVREIDSGCCGMAGSFGYEHPALSQKIAENRLLPTIRAHPNAQIAAPGTSCRVQIHEAGLPAQHPVEIIAHALKP